MLFLDIDEIFDRIKEIEGYRFDKQVSAKLGIKSITNHRHRQSVPLAPLIEYALRNKVDLEYLFFGYKRKNLKVSL